MLEVLRAAPAQLKIVIAGNHDITLDREYYESHFKGERLEDLDIAKKMWTGEEARNAGFIYLEEGISTLECKNGARFTIYSSPYQPEFCDWAFPYRRDEDRFNPSKPVSKKKAANPVPDFPDVDIMLTHGPPHGILDMTSRGEAAGCEHLRRADRRCRPLIHCFGHIHEGWGAERMDWSNGKLHRLQFDERQILQERSAQIDLSDKGPNPLRFGEETMFINAAIMNLRYQPTNAPWVVDVDLPMRGAE